MGEFKFKSPKLEALFEREMEDGLEAYELRQILKRAQIQQIQKDDNCTEQEAAKRWVVAREIRIRRVRTLVESERGVECSGEDAERIVRRAEWDQAKDLISRLPNDDSTKRKRIHAPSLFSSQPHLRMLAGIAMFVVPTGLVAEAGWPGLAALAVIGVAGYLVDRRCSGLFQRVGELAWFTVFVWALMCGFLAVIGTVLWLGVEAFGWLTS